MKFVARLARFLALLAIVDVTIYLVLTNNVRNGVYPVDADSIGIPLMESAIHSVVAGALLLAAASMSSLHALCRQARVSNVCRHMVAVLLGLTHLAAAAFFFLWGLSWAGAEHYWIVTVAVLASLCVLYCAGVDLYLRANANAEP